MTISFVIPVRNDAQRLSRCLRSILANSCPGVTIELIVADNGSTDQSAAVARMHGARVLDLPGRRLGELRNHAAREACGSVLAFVDADHEIGPGWIRAALESLADSSVVAVGCDCHPPAAPTWVQRTYDRLRRHPSTRQTVEWLGSGNMAVRRQSFLDVNGFDLTLETCEDVDLCRKLRRAGGTLRCEPRMFNIHYGDPVTVGRVFAGELWRGRDNLRVSLRQPRAASTVISAAIPMFNLACAGSAMVGLLLASGPGLLFAALATSLLVAELLLRTVRMTGLRVDPVSLGQAFVVAVAYEGGRALAIAARAGYERRRNGAGV